MEKRNLLLKLTTINSEMYSIVNNYITYKKLSSFCISVEVYSKETKTWKHQYVNFEERFLYCLCSFMSKLYIIGRCVIGEEESLSSCNIYNINSNERNKIADLNKSRCLAACTVFEGKIVVTGSILRSDCLLLKSVESYDFNEKKWTYLPDMNEKRYLHASVSMGNKFFVIGGSRISSSEVFDSCSRKFSIINSQMNLSTLVRNPFKSFSIGSNIVVFHHS